MDTNRLQKLAGMDTNILREYDESVKEMELLEKMYPGRHGLNIDTNQISVEEIQKRMEAASRALSIVHRMRDPQYKKQHFARIMSNMNTIRGALKYMMNQADQELDV